MPEAQVRMGMRRYENPRNSSLPDSFTRQRGSVLTLITLINIFITHGIYNRLPLAVNETVASSSGVGHAATEITKETK